jgi:hypothetical protein
MVYCDMDSSVRDYFPVVMNRSEPGFIFPRRFNAAGRICGRKNLLNLGMDSEILTPIAVASTKLTSTWRPLLGGGHASLVMPI